MNKTELTKHIKELTHYLVDGYNVDKDLILQHEGAIELLCEHYSNNKMIDGYIVVEGKKTKEELEQIKIKWNNGWRTNPDTGKFEMHRIYVIKPTILQKIKNLFNKL